MISDKTAPNKNDIRTYTIEYQNDIWYHKPGTKTNPSLYYDTVPDQKFSREDRLWLNRYLIIPSQRIIIFLHTSQRKMIPHTSQTAHSSSSKPYMINECQSKMLPNCIVPAQSSSDLAIPEEMSPEYNSPDEKYPGTHTVKHQNNLWWHRPRTKSASDHSSRKNDTWSKRARPKWSLITCLRPNRSLITPFLNIITPFHVKMVLDQTVSVQNDLWSHRPRKLLSFFTISQRKMSSECTIPHQNDLWSTSPRTKWFLITTPGTKWSLNLITPFHKIISRAFLKPFGWRLEINYKQRTTNMPPLFLIFQLFPFNGDFRKYFSI